MATLSVSAVLKDAWLIYRLLFRRSFPIALIVYAVLNGVDLVNDTILAGGPGAGLALLGFVLWLGGPILVQGALVKIVRSVHEGTRPETAARLVRDAWERIGSLVGASLVYSFGVLVGLVLLVVPGLLAAARWCLMAPAIMLEGRWAMPARERSSQIVRGETLNSVGNRTRFVLAVVLASWILTTGIPWGLQYFVYWRVWDWSGWLLGIVSGALLAPYQAHVLSVLYYRLVDPARPAVDPQVWGWRSVWDAVPERA